MPRDTLYIVIPAYNESGNIRHVVHDWHAIVQAHAGFTEKGQPTSRLVIIDDGSKDDTYAILQSLVKDYPLLVPITKPNSGHGATILYGYRYAIEHGADYVFQTDSDGQTDPAEFEAFWDRRTDNDMVIGWRRGRQDGLSRVVTTRVLRLAVWLFLGVWVKDANTPFRLMKARPLKDALRLIPEKFFLSTVLLSAIFIRKGEPVAFLPVTFKPRQAGTNSINIPRIFRIGCRSVIAFLRLRPIMEKIGRDARKNDPTSRDTKGGRDA